MFELVADEHVPSPVVNALRSNGYDVCHAQEEYGQGEEDAALLEACADDGRVLLTNDNDFARLNDEVEHAGIVVYNDQELQPRSVVRGVVLIDDAYDELDDRLEWLEGWI